MADAAVRPEHLRLVGAGERAAAGDADAARGHRVDPLAEPAGRAARAARVGRRRRGQLAHVRRARRLVDRAEHDVRAGELRGACCRRGGGLALGHHRAHDRADRHQRAGGREQREDARATTQRRAPRAWSAARTR